MNRPYDTERRAILWTGRARRDLEAIGDYIARDDPVAAVRWIEQLFGAVEQAASMPRSGRVVPEVGDRDVREIIRGRYRIVYRVRAAAIVVLTVFEGHRLLDEFHLDPADR